MNCPKCNSEVVFLEDDIIEYQKDLLTKAYDKVNELKIKLTDAEDKVKQPIVMEAVSRIENLKLALEEALSYLPDAEDRYTWVWGECTDVEQHMVKTIRAKLTAILEEV